MIDAELAKKLAAQKQKIEDDVVSQEVTETICSSEDVPGVVTTTKTTTIVTHKASDEDTKRRDSILFQDVSNELERLDSTTEKSQPSPIPDGNFHTCYYLFT